jgi:hypothetical protein
MKERTRRILFLALFSLVFYHLGGHLTQSFVNYNAWKWLENASFREYHAAMSFHALFMLMIPRQLEVLGAAILWRFPPGGLKRSHIGIVFALALFGLLWTILAVRPVQAALSEVGNTPELLARLAFVDTVRLVTETIRAALYVWMMWTFVRENRGRVSTLHPA